MTVDDMASCHEEVRASSSLPGGRGAVKRQQTLAILGLPYELREAIYTFALVSPTPRWERLHDICCKWKPRRPDECERPLFTFHSDDGKMICPCACGKRKAAFGLLGANRFIRAEAAPIFWSQNIFSFEDAGTFVLDFADASDGDNVMALPGDRRRFPLPDDKRRLGGDQDPFLYASELIRHVHMFNNIDEERLEAFSDSCLNDFWRALPRLRALRTLEIPPNWLSSSVECLSALRGGSPHLESVSLCEYVGYDACRPVGLPRRSDESVFGMKHRLWAKASKEIDLGAADHMDGLTGEALSFGVELMSDVEDAICEVIPPIWQEGATVEERQALTLQRATTTPFFPHHFSELAPCKGVATVQLHDKSIIKLPLFGLPLSAEQVAANEAWRRSEDGKRRDAEAERSPYGQVPEGVPWMLLMTAQCMLEDDCPEGNRVFRGN